MKAVLFLVIHDLLPTNERLHRINLTETLRCKVCGGNDTSLHRLIECQGRRAVWEETRKKLALILRTSPAHIQSDWVLKPPFSIWSPKRHGAVLWVLAHMVLFRMIERERER
jgi:hypothetical protein